MSHNNSASTLAQGNPDVNYRSVLQSLLPPHTPHRFISLPTSPVPISIPSSRITSLSLHPALESALHILNQDLPSAHFLLRHMQSPPAWEAMFLHGILHRIETDVDKNARAWYTNVADGGDEAEVWSAVWGGESSNNDGESNPSNGENGVTTSSGDQDRQTSSKEKAMAFLSRIDSFRKTHFTPKTYIEFERGRLKPEVDAELRYLTATSLSELKKVIRFCEEKFGCDAITDTSHIWISNLNTKHGKIAEQMIVGGEGWREF